MARTPRELELLKLYKIELTKADLVWGLDVPFGIKEQIEVHMWGAGGGGGGNDGPSQGGAGAGGQYAKVVLNVSPGDHLALVLGGAGLSGQSSRGLARGGNAGSGFIYRSKSYSGGIGGNAGAAGSSGGGGGGGGATVLLLNGEVIAIAGGGGGGGGAGITSGGQPAGNPPGNPTSFTNGEQGQDKRGDGGGGGGSAGGYNAGGSGSDTQSGDTGAPPGKSADVLIPNNPGVNEKTFGNGVLPGKYLDADYAFYTGQISAAGVGIGGGTSANGKDGGAVIIYQPALAYYKVGNVWNHVQEVYTKQSGSWNVVSNAYVKSGGEWLPLYSGDFVVARANTGRAGIDYRFRNMVPAPVPVYTYDGGGDGGGPGSDGCGVGDSAGGGACSF